MSWLSQYFLNPSFVLPGAALAAIPIIIHLLSRLRYKKVRFAAMEFLLQSEELNRRRLIIEQLLLLFLRVLAVILIMLLLARLALDPSSMLLMRGATTHHVLILDDTLSMRAIDGEKSTFQKAIDTLQRMTSQGGSQPKSQRITVLTITQPDRPLVTDRTLDSALMQELAPRLNNLTCSYKHASPVAALKAAEDILSSDGGIAPQVHVITDLRKVDWENRPELVQALESLNDIDAQVTLVQLSDQSTNNVVVSQMTAETLAVAVGIPWRLNLAFENNSSQQSSGLRAIVFVDGNALPIKVLIPDIDPGETAEIAHDITFESPGLHEVEVRLEEDNLLEDNSRFIAVEVTNNRKVLVVDDETRQEDSQLMSLAISDPDLTGVVADIRDSDVLTAAQLNDYDSIYLLNVRELPADAVELLKTYVASGGGLVWFPDGQANTAWYNSLQSSQPALFPVQLTTVHSEPASDDSDEPQFEVPTFEQHPIFLLYNAPESRLADALQFKKWFLVSEAMTSDALLKGGVRILSRMSNGDPVIFEHKIGKGRVLTFLTTAGKRWSNWPIADQPGYVVMHLLMSRYLQKPASKVKEQEIAELLKLTWPISQFTETLNVILPASETQNANEDTFLRLQAAPVVKPDNSSTAAASEQNGSDQQLAITLPQANRPGIYRIKRFRLDGETDEQWLAMNVPITESDLTVASAATVEQQVKSGHVSVVAADVSDELSGSDAGREMRWFLLALLIAVLICEQLLSLRMSFHPEVKS